MHVRKKELCFVLQAVTRKQAHSESRNSCRVVALLESWGTAEVDLSLRAPDKVGDPVFFMHLAPLPLSCYFTVSVGAGAVAVTASWVVAGGVGGGCESRVPESDCWLLFSSSSKAHGVCLRKLDQVVMS